MTNASATTTHHLDPPSPTQQPEENALLTVTFCAEIKQDLLKKEFRAEMASMRSKHTETQLLFGRSGACLTCDGISHYFKVLADVEDFLAKGSHSSLEM